jgi:hypothetical protein
MTNAGADMAFLGLPSCGFGVLIDIIVAQKPIGRPGAGLASCR